MSSRDAREPSPITGNRAIQVPVSAAATVLGTVVVTCVLGLCGWLWLLHQRTDQIPVIIERVDNVRKEVEAIRNGLGIPAPPATAVNDRPARGAQ